MSHKKIKYIIGLMAFALIGLIIFQLYFIKFTINTKNEQFKGEVFDAMNQVVRKLEKKELFYLTQKKKNIEEKQNTINALAKSKKYILNKPIASTKKKRIRSKTSEENKLAFNPEYSVKMPQTVVPSDILIQRRVEILPNGEVLATEEYSMDMNLEDLERQIAASNQMGEMFGDLYNNKETISLNDQPIQAKTNKKNRIKKSKPNIKVEIAKPIDDKRQLVQEVFNDMYFGKKNIFDRLSYALLDSLLHAEFKLRNISIPFEFGVKTDNKNNILHFASSIDFKKNSNNYSNDTYEAALFPNDMGTDSNVLKIYFPNQNQYIMRYMWETYLSSFVLIMVILGCFYAAVMAILKQKKNADIKNDFINNMTHEFRTPISTISLATQMLGEINNTSNASAFQRYLGIIKDENTRLSNQVEKVLQTAQMDKGGQAMNFENIDIHQVIQNVIVNISPQIDLREGEIKMQLAATNHNILADEVHITNVIFNLLDNAIKYSTGKPVIHLSTQSYKNQLFVTIKDNGIGMTKESIKNIFDKFYRVPTGNVHNVKGFGLGLSYVKKIVTMHNGNISVKSKLNEGSEFEITLPLNQHS
ncbi:MAG: GHKL domain-containing protein [Pseudarcicella sp.]|nr:GHKL domain-containing protein [Pseudarcicella sp.]